MTKISANKQALLVDANVISHIAAPIGICYDAPTQRFQSISRSFWTSIQDFQVVISRTVWKEISHGGGEDAARCQAIVKGINVLEIIPEVSELADTFIDRGVLRKKAGKDALILANCCIYNIDYLITWNMRDLANDTKQKTMIKIVEQHGYCSPKIFTPEVFMIKHLEELSYNIEDSNVKEASADYLFYNVSAMKDTKETLTTEGIEESPLVEKFRQIRRDIFAEYDNDNKKYAEALMAEPRVPGMKYIEPPPLHPGIKSLLEEQRKIKSKESS